MTAAVVASPRPRRVSPSAGVLVHHVFNLAPMILAHAAVLAIPWSGAATWHWLVLPLFLYARGFLTTAGYHRYFAHRSYKTSRVGQFLLAFFCCTNLQQGPLWWAVHHRLHHKHSDGPDDPHSPRHGVFWAYCGWLFVPLDPDWRLVNDLRRFPELVWLERFWQVPAVLTAGLCWWVGGWGLVCVGFCLSAVFVFHMTFLVNTAAHLVGTRRFATKDTSRNSFLLALVTMGDGWHNNHHHYPNAAQAGFFKGEVDGAFLAICALERMGLVWGVKRVPAHKLAAAGTPAARE